MRQQYFNRAICRSLRVHPTAWALQTLQGRPTTKYKSHCASRIFFFFLLLVLCMTNKKCTFRPQAAAAVWPCCSEISGGSACSSNPETLNNCSQNSAPHHLPNPNPNLPRALIHNTPSTLSTIILFSSQHWSFFPPQQQVKCELLLLLVEVVG